MLRRVIAGAVSVAALAAAGSAGLYRVRAGDTLSGVASRHGVSVRALAAANGISDHDHLLAGASLAIPTAKPGVRQGTTYVVRSGDTLERIARRFGTTTSRLMTANGIRSANLVQLGRRLVIPAGSTAVTASTPPPRATGLPSRLRERPERLAYLPLFDRWAHAYGVPADLLKAMTWVESGWQKGKVSSTGAVGIGQLMPDTVTFVSGTLLRTRLDPRVPEHNIRMSARFLRYLLDQTGWRTDQALSAYYQGLRSVRERGVFGETRQYVAAILAFRPRFR